MTQYKEESILAQRIFLERIQEYNKVWADAEKHVDGLLAAKGLKPGMHFPYIGVPPVIRKAAEGDLEAIAEVKIAITSADQMEADWGRPWAIDVTQEQPQFDPAGMNFGKSLGVIVALLLAFTSAWTCLCLIVGPNYVAEVVRFQSDDKTPLDSSHHSPSDDAETRSQHQLVVSSFRRGDAGDCTHHQITNHCQLHPSSDTSCPRVPSRSERTTLFFPAFCSIPTSSG